MLLDLIFMLDKLPEASYLTNLLPSLSVNNTEKDYNIFI
jgi:hypothetical protein